MRPLVAQLESIMRNLRGADDPYPDEGEAADEPGWDGNPSSKLAAGDITRGEFRRQIDAQAARIERRLRGGTLPP